MKCQCALCVKERMGGLEQSGYIIGGCVPLACASVLQRRAWG